MKIFVKFAYVPAICLILLLVSACAINQKHLNNATEACAEHGGIYDIYRDGKNVDGHCKDGTFFNNLSGN